MERSWSVKATAKESLYCAQRNPGEKPCSHWELEKDGNHQDSEVTMPQTRGDTGHLSLVFPEA